MTATPPLTHLLVVDDDERLRRLLQQFLRQHGYAVSVATDAADARVWLDYAVPDLIIVDVMMPGESGLDFAADLRRKRNIPFFFLSAMGEAENRIAGLSQGAEDYIAKPFEPQELLLRISAILKRVRPQAAEHCYFGPYRFDRATQELMRGGEPVNLTHTEKQLVAALSAQPREPVTREALAGRLGYKDNERAVDVCVTRLRRKIEDNPRQPRYIQTMRGEGYALWP